MGNDNANARTIPPQQPEAKPRAPAEPIAIRKLYFRDSNGVQLPGHDSPVKSIVGGDKEFVERTYEIALLPWLRQFKVTSTRGKVKTTFLIPESWASSEIAE